MSLLQLTGIPLRRECVRQATQVELGVSSVGMVVVSLLHHSPDLGVQFDPLLPPTRRVATGDLLSDLGVEMVLFVLHFGQKRYNVGMLTAHDVVESVMPAFQSIRGPPEPCQRPLILGPLSWRVPEKRCEIYQRLSAVDHTRRNDLFVYLSLLWPLINAISQTQKRR